ncbi:histone-lysine N-methyltransferase PRDM9-like [Spodoptera litura]|uniref:Histone-lysine N-methyltransferase PRDM9-like n=1 Tax=Spodoptera litura TaxID=69820 RepID=A0A9J7ESA7_SPOLT|nr:histone-lysine N-methyltransferase PRDM9-like [Spodoptera litura]
MSDLKVCRICLCKDVKIYSYDRFHLKQYYEEVLRKKINKQDGLPNCFCYECASMLYKFHKFKEKCHRGEQALTELLWNGPITLSSISKIDRESNNLKSSINILSTNKRVRTYTIKSKTLKLLKKEIKNVEPEFKIDYDSDSSVDSKNLAEIKNEMLYEKEECKMSKETINNDFENVITGLETDDIFDDNEDIEESKQTEELNDFKDIKEESTIDNNIDQENNYNIEIEEIKIIHKRKKAKKKNVEVKSKKFEVLGTEDNKLDPNHWLKINLSEEEALEGFTARAKDRKYLSAAYQCNDCYKGFSKEDMLNRHFKLRHCESVGPIVCRFCHMRFKWKCYLTRHITQHYTKYKCLRCDLICPLKNTALFHNEYHNGVIRKCMHCGEEFRHLSTYYTHLRTHRSEHVCTLCGASFVSNNGLNMHKRTMHVTTVVNRDEEEVNTYCSRCDIRFETRKAYEEHLYHSAKHTEGFEDLACDSSAVSIPKRRKKFFRRNPRKMTPCNICNKNFPSLAAYMKHHSAEHKDEPLPTKDEERHICEICGASLAASSVASRLNTHTREKLYTCAICHMQFNSKGSMNRHQLTHTGEKPYECSMCQKRFTQKCSMQLHYRTFHLKQPYPKRNRRKVPVNQLEIEDYRIINDDSEENHKVDRWR